MIILKQRVQELEVEIQGKQDLTNENERLKDLLQLKQESKYQILPARIIGRDPSAWFNASHYQSRKCRRCKTLYAGCHKWRIGRQNYGGQSFDFASHFGDG